MRWRDLRIGSKLTTGFLLVASALLVMGAVQFYSLSSMRGKTRDIVEAAPLVYAAKEMRFSTARNLQIMKEMLSETDKGALEALLGKSEVYSARFALFADAILNGAETDEGVVYPARNDAIKEIVREALKYSSDTFAPHIRKIYGIMSRDVSGQVGEDLKKQLSSLESGVDVTGEAMLQILAEVDGMVREEIRKTEQDSEKNATSLMLYSALWIFLGFVISLLMGLVITRNITVPMEKCVHFATTISRGEINSTLRMDRRDETGLLASTLSGMAANLKRIAQEIVRSTDVIASSSEELSRTTFELAEGARSQSSQTEQSATSMTEMSQTILEVAKNAGDVAQVARDTMSVAKEGRDKVEETVKGMRHIADTVNSSASTVEELGRSGTQIGEIINTISEIADQTNLLALNAAIEAARAGELGRGFAVVADEVRKLAERTGKATREIEDMITKIQSDTGLSVQSMASVKAEVEGGVRLSEEAMASLEQIVRASDKSADMVQRIASSTEQQSSAIEEVSSTIDEIAGITRKNEGSSVQIQNAVQELARVTSEMKQTVAWFKT
jgi:methyl-accepting chemotaxis protein